MTSFVRLTVAVLLGTAACATHAQITLYGQEGLRGRAVTIEGSVPNLAGSRSNDRASSMTVRDGTWQLCTEPYYRGTCVTVGRGDYPSLRAAGLNNQVSSVREIGWQGGTGGQGSINRGLVLFDQPNFSGGSVKVDGIAESLDRFNDRARSMIVYEGEWELCEHDRFRGNCMVFREGQHANLGPLSGDVSSLRPLSGASTPAPAPAPAPAPGGGNWGRDARAVLYEGSGFRGRSLMVNDDVVENLQGTGLNDRVSSIRVERGYWLFCSDAYFRGECRTFGPGDYPQLPAGLTDRVSSGRRIYQDYPYDREPNWSR
ncbi:MAG TPA: beta/gamma crystallin-related protein [Casimicrobiaceae bacterium]|nr:beta/gamma crystallin-related protein [Casimicrobiaceae bacterium]